MRVPREVIDALDRQHYSCKERKGLQTWRGLELHHVMRMEGIDTQTALKAMRAVANRYPVKPGETRCKSCGMPIRFRVDGKPYDRENKNHFIACPNREAHRRKKK